MVALERRGTTELYSVEPSAAVRFEHTVFDEPGADQ